MLYSASRERECKKDFLAKCILLDSYYEEYTPERFYEYIFQSDTIESPAKSEGRPNPIYAIQVLKTDKDGKQLYKTIKTKEGLPVKIKQSYMVNKIMTNDYNFGDDFRESDFVICGLYASWGKKRGSKSAFTLYGFAFDIDGVGFDQLNRLLYGIDTKFYPCPTFIVNSGHGVHLYYIFEQPIPLYPKLKPTLERIKKGLTYVLWNNDTTDEYAGNRQFQSIYQSMRMVGSKTKFGKGTKRTKYKLRAWKTGGRVDLTYLDHYVGVEYKMQKNNRDYGSAAEETLSLEKAKELYPDWYKRRIENGEEQGRYYCNRGLYDWWLNKIKTDEDLRDGHRYYAVSVLYVYAVKCGVSYEEVEGDALSLVPYLNSLTQRPNNEFTVDDAVAAGSMYDGRWCRMSRDFIENKTALDCRSHNMQNRKNLNSGHPKNNREKHCEKMRMMRSFATYEGSGRPTKENLVKEYFLANPDAGIRQAARELGISTNTVMKWIKRDKNADR